jgi:hypothetical protein
MNFVAKRNVLGVNQVRTAVATKVMPAALPRIAFLDGYALSDADAAGSPDSTTTSCRSAVATCMRGQSRQCQIRQPRIRQVQHWRAGGEAPLGG